MNTELKNDTDMLSNGGIAADTISQGAAANAEKLWKEFIDLLEITEESDSGNRFRPNYIGSCRALDGQRMNQIIKEARGMVFDAPKE
jgi:hypothetical protein